MPFFGPGRSVLLRAGSGPAILCIYRKVPFGADWCWFRGETAVLKSNKEKIKSNI